MITRQTSTRSDFLQGALVLCSDFVELVLMLLGQLADFFPHLGKREHAGIFQSKKSILVVTLFLTGGRAFFLFQIERLQTQLMTAEMTCSFQRVPWQYIHISADLDFFSFDGNGAKARDKTVYFCFFAWYKTVSNKSGPNMIPAIP